MRAHHALRTCIMCICSIVLCPPFLKSYIRPWGVVRHVGAVHAHEAGFSVCCGVLGCPRTYRKFHSYRKHLYVHHREELDIAAPDALTSRRPGLGGSNISPPASPHDHSLRHATCMSKRDAAMFILKTKEVHKVSQSDLRGLIDDILSIVESTVHLLETKVEVALEDRGIGMNEELRQVFRSPLVNDPFQRLHTEYLQKKFFREKFHLVVSASGVNY